LRIVISMLHNPNARSDDLQSCNSKPELQDCAFLYVLNDAQELAFQATIAEDVAMK